jgi:probable HAF family extracellular repeat protein
VNDATQVVGFTHATLAFSDQWVPFIWRDKNGNGADDPGEMRLIPTLGGRNGQATAINNVGRVAGGSDVAGTTVRHPFLWSDGKLHDLGILPGHAWGEALGMNDGSDIVGYSASHEGAPNAEAFLYTRGMLTNLNSLIPPDTGWTLAEAHDINSSGQIAGWGSVSGRTHAFLLTPNTAMVAFTYGTVESNRMLVAWSAFGSNVATTLERRRTPFTEDWAVVPPTNQWPVTGTVFEGDVDGTFTNPNIRAVLH